MTLLDDYMETCIMYDKRIVDDGYGGYKPIYTEGITFKAAFALDDSVEAQVAQSDEGVGVYSVTTGREINLQYHDVFRRESDSKIFRVTSDGDDKKTPRRAHLNMRQVSAQEWRLPDE